MKLDDFLKCKKVRCVTDKGDGEGLTVGKEYKVIDTSVSIKVLDDEGYYFWRIHDRFEPVLDSAETPLQNIELTSEFEAVVPHVNPPSNNDTYVGEHNFKAGDKVYAPSVGSKIYTVKYVGDGWCYPIRIDCNYDEDHEFTKEGLITAEGLPILFLATELNHALLSQLYPHIDFEAPPKPLTGSDLSRDLIKKGWKGFTCVCGNSGDDNVMITTIVTGTNNSGQFVDFKGRFFNNAMPMLGSYQLTQAVLDE